MRTITDEQARLISDAKAEGLVALSAAILEKDVLVTEALHAIANINIPDVTLTFSGGTCLSKAYGLLNRMSEDIDLRLTVEKLDGLTPSATRSRLRPIKGLILAALRDAQFYVPDEAVEASNNNKKEAVGDSARCAGRDTEAR